jgi:hypothetical protein
MIYVDWCGECGGYLLKLFQMKLNLLLLVVGQEVHIPAPESHFSRDRCVDLKMKAVGYEK